MKALRWIGVGIAMVLLVLLAVIVCRSLPRGSAQRYDEELALTRISIPQGSNAFYVLEQAGGHMWWPKEQDTEIRELAFNTNWDDAFAATMLASNLDAFAGWDTAIKLPEMQEPDATAYDSDKPYLTNWKRLAQLAQIRQNVFLHAGHDQEAFDQIVDEIKMGRRMQNAQGDLIDYMVGTAVSSMGLMQMRSWVGKTHLTADQLKDFAQKLETTPTEAGVACANSCRAQYQMSMAMLDAMRNGTYTNAEMTVPDSHLWPVWPLISFNQTKRLFAEGALRLINAAPHPYSEAKVEDLLARPGMVSMFLSGNPIGQILYYMWFPAMTSGLEKKSRGDVQLQATRIILALRAYELTHGNLPENLAALVPEFLDKVPLDDFDGKAMRYSAEKKIVYSVGKNLKDDGGNDSVATTPAESHLDIAFKFDF